MLLPKPRLRLETGRPRRPPDGRPRRPTVQSLVRHKVHQDQLSQLRRGQQDIWVEKETVGRLGASNAGSTGVHPSVPGHVPVEMGAGCLWALVVQ